MVSEEEVRAAHAYCAVTSVLLGLVGCALALALALVLVLTAADTDMEDAVPASCRGMLLVYTCGVEATAASPRASGWAKDL